MQLMPQGVSGELHISGINIARGYLGQPELTAERFVPNPFSEAGERLYRTGDLACIREDGKLEFVGRLDRQIKLRGYRVELGEIEAALSDHTFVKNSAAVMQGEGSASKLVVFVVRRGPAAASDLLDYLRSRLPGYMLPSAIHFLESLPLTPTGKVDSRFLENLSPPLSTEEKEGEPEDEIEMALRTIWQKVFDLQKIGIHDGFYELGGHSLHALRLVSRIEERFNCHLPIKQFLELQTIHRLALYLHAMSLDFTTETIGSDGPLDLVPLTESQSGLWYISKLAGSGVQYNIPAVFLMKGSLNINALQASLKSVAQRHDSLRTVFLQADDAVYQVVLSSFSPEIVVEDALDLSVNENKWIEMKAAEFNRIPFDLEQKPPWRVGLIHLRTDVQILLFCFHHLVFDEWSLEIFLKELGDAYRELLNFPRIEFTRSKLQLCRLCFCTAGLAEITGGSKSVSLLD